ncbi:MAG: lysylphosphatidylglycerol synthase domain-containing protein [Candidatus Poribacteria bacterium]|nr:lysylphosphatidylglycerol synthase domain-containing protein [Candidatus Poribacteria bacterium]
MKILRQYVGLLIAGMLFYFLIKPFIQTHTELKGATFQIHWGWLVCSFGAILFYWSAYLYPFAILLSGIAAKHVVSFRTAFTLFHLANITRYLPGRIWGVVRLLSLSHRFRLSKTAVGGSLTLHVGIETILGGLIGMSLIFSPKMRGSALGIIDKISAHTTLLSLVCIGILIGTLFLIPTLSSKARQFLKTLRDTGVPLFQEPFRHQWLNIFASHIFLWICQGLAFFLFVRSFVPTAWMDAGVLTACFAFAWVIGFLSFLTPGGLGVREGLLSLLLSSYMPAPQATLVALLCRVWMLSAEIVLAGVAFTLNKHVKR